MRRWVKWSLILGFGVFAANTVFAAHKCVDNTLESRNYGNNEGFELEFGGPLVVTSIQFQTRGARGARLEAYNNGVHQDTYRYDYSWSDDWAVFDVSNPVPASRFYFRFKDDPVISRVVVYCEAERKIEYRVKWRIKEVPMERLSDNIRAIRRSMSKLKDRADFSGGVVQDMFYGGWMLLTPARYKAEAKRGYNADTSGIVGDSLNQFLSEFACDDATEVFSDLEYRYPGIRRQISKLAVRIHKAAALRDYEPAACGPKMRAWRDRYFRSAD